MGSVLRADNGPFTDPSSCRAVTWRRRSLKKVLLRSAFSFKFSRIYWCNFDVSICNSISKARASRFECLQCSQWIASIPEVTSTWGCVVLVHVRQVALRGGFGEQANKFQTDSSEGEDEGGAVTGVLNAQIVHWTHTTHCSSTLVQHKICKQHIEPQHSVVQSEPGPGLVGASGQVGRSLRRWWVRAVVVNYSQKGAGAPAEQFIFS